LGQRGLTATYEHDPERRENTEPTQAMHETNKILL